MGHIFGNCSYGCPILCRTLQPLFLSGFTLKPICGALKRRYSTSQPLSGTTVIELCNNLGVDNLCRSSHNNLPMSTFKFISLDLGGSSSYHPDIGSSSSFHPEQPLISFDMFGNNMYSTPPQATFNPAVDPPDVYSTPQRLPHQRIPVNLYTPNDDTTPDSFQF
ncbi:hypothetical protein GOBAR_DD03047 [Gossypium barbadense]|nr:hypothetical protein GOBAR_DD03047 [Gossypium barbadense]